LDAAATVGRDPSPWLSSLPVLAANELLARLAPLAAYLHHDGATSPALLRPSPVYSFGAEKSAQGAMAYRLGMTMTEWVAKEMIGLPATTHHEDAAPIGAGPEWFGAGKRPDLWSEDPNVTPSIWSLEAKAGRRLSQGTLREGALQLAALGPTVLPVQHGRVLVGTSIDDRLFTIVQHEVHTKRQHVGADAAALPSVRPADDLYNLARSRLIVFLLLRSAGYASLRTRSVSRGSQDVRYGETDPETQQLRRTISLRPDLYQRRLPQTWSARTTDMLTSAVPGTGITMGMSYGLFRACASLMESLQASILDVIQERPDWSRFSSTERTVVAILRDPRRSEEEEEEDLVDFKEAIDERVRPTRVGLTDAYERGEEEGPEVVDFPERELEPPELEIYTADTYLAVSPNSPLLSPLRR